jgi:signal transduction histidine kinase
MAVGDENNAHLQEINQEIYKRNMELAVVNRTLSLLRKLYQISLLALDPDSLSDKISETVRVDLNMETVAIFKFDEPKNTLLPYAVSKSERLAGAMLVVGIKDENLLVTNATTRPIVREVIGEQKSLIDVSLESLWEGLLPQEKLKQIAEQSHMQTVIIYPLVTRGRSIGLLALGLNRSYAQLSHFEQDAISSFPDVVAVALDKALLYEELKVANEQLKALDKARAEFISIASHQLRTPPATIKWYLAAVLAGDFGELKDDMKAALQRTMVTNDAQIATIDDLLNASRIERGKLEFFFEKGPFEPIVSALVEQLQPLAQMKKMSIEYKKPLEVLPDIMMDKEKVRQIINNMIDNAIKYSKQGVIKVGLKQEDGNLVVSVSDNGKGIRKEELASIFDKYTRGHDSVTHATGLGLGMYVAKIIVEQHHGKIWAESPGEGKGSTFFFSIPINSTLEATTVDLVKPA